MKKDMSKKKLLTYAYKGCLQYLDEVAQEYQKVFQRDGEVPGKLQEELDQCLTDADELKDRLIKECEKGAVCG